MTNAVSAGSIGRAMPPALSGAGATAGAGVSGDTWAVILVEGNSSGGASGDGANGTAGAAGAGIAPSAAGISRSIASSRRISALGRGNPPFGVLCQQLVDDLLEFGRHVRDQVAHRQRLLHALFQKDFRQRLAAKGRPPRQQHVEHPAQAVKVRAGADRAALGLLRRHELGRAQHAAGDRVPPAAEEPRDAEVGKLHLALGGQQQIARLDVAMDDAAVVGVAEGLGQLDADPQHFAPGEDPPAAQLGFEAVAGDQFHGVEEVVALLAEAEEADDMGMVELAEGLDLRLEAVAEVGLMDERFGQQLDGGRLAAFDVDAFIDGAHAAAAEFPPDSVGT